MKAMGTGEKGEKRHPLVQNVFIKKPLVHQILSVGDGAVKQAWPARAFTKLSC